ncbi:MAG: HpcH/HpaI aldolase/citrate lyase family protein, partial [Nitrospinota bacterium]
MEDRRMTLVRRSLLYMPANVPRFVESAWRRGADAIILDLEDSVAPSEKGRARSLVRDSIPLAARGASDVFVRVNNRPELLPEDLDASIWPGLAGVAFPKPEGPEELCALDEAIGRLERERGLSPGSVEVYTSIESAATFLRAREIALATRRLSHIAISSEDLPRDLGLEPTVEGGEILFAKQYLIYVAREAEAQPLGLMGTMTRFDDLEALRES